MRVWQFIYYSIKEPEKVGKYYIENPEYISFSYSAFLSDFCIKNRVEKTDVLFQIKKTILK